VSSVILLRRTNPAMATPPRKTLSTTIWPGKANGRSSDLVAENNALRREIDRLRGKNAYEDWFSRIFSVRLSSPITLPFTTFTHGTPWCERVADGMQDAEILYAEHLLEGLHRDSISGAIVEFGIYYGYWVSLLCELQERHGWQREIWGFDSFEGLPSPQRGIDPAVWTQGQYAAPIEEVKAGLQLDERPYLHLVKGWFSNTLSEEPARSIRDVAYARIDSDLYGSCVDCLNYLAPRLVRGAILVFDDWQFSTDTGEVRAFSEWYEANPGWKFEFLCMNLWAHLYLRVLDRPAR
jgi:hypothetical protein